MSEAKLLTAFIQLAEELGEYQDITSPIKVKVPASLYRRLEWELAKSNLLLGIRPSVRGKQSLPTFIMIHDFVCIEPLE